MKSFLLCIFLLFTGLLSGQYYSKPNGNLNDPLTWGVFPDGEGASPLDFTEGDQIYIICNNPNPTIDADWIVSGPGSLVVLGDGTNPCTFTVPANFLVIADMDVSNNGTLRVTSGAASPFLGHLIIKGGGTYEHARDAGAIPQANWYPNSNCLITGLTGSGIFGLNQQFWNFTWDCESQNNGISMEELSAVHGGAVNGDLSILSTGTGYIQYTDIQNSSLVIDGNFNISDGILNLSTGTGTGTFFLLGDFNMSGGAITETGSGAGEFIFNGDTEQNFIKPGGSISDLIHFTVNGDAIFNMGTNVLNGSSGNFILNDFGTLKIGSPEGISSSGDTGNIQVSGSRIFSSYANYEYNGSEPQITGIGLPSIVNNLTVNNNSGITLSRNVAVSNLLYMNGNIKCPVNDTLTIISDDVDAIIRTAGSVTGLLSRKIGLASVEYFFPIGYDSLFNPLNITFTDLNQGYLKVRFVYGDITSAAGTFPINNNGSEIYDYFDQAYWELIAEFPLSSTNYDLNLNYEGFTGVNTSSRILKDNEDSGNLFINGIHNGVTVSPNEISVTGLSGISTLNTQFVIGAGRPLISSHPSDQIVCEGANVIFEVEATGEGELNYQWQVDIGEGFNNINNIDPYSGTNSSQLTITDVDFSMNGYFYKCIITDVGSNSSSSDSAELIVEDSTNPVITCPGNVTLSCESDLSPAGAGDTATATDNCTDAAYINITYSDVIIRDPDTSSIGYYNYTITRTWRATDVSGNFSECSQILTVEDVTNPVITCPEDVTLSCESDHSPAGAGGTATTTDNCTDAAYINITYSDVSTRDVDPASIGYYNYTITRTWRATEVSGNFSESPQILTIADVANPIVVCKDITVYLDVTTGDVTISPEDINGGVSDNGGSFNLSISKSTFNCLDLGVNNVWLYAEDISANIDSCQALITVSYLIEPDPFANPEDTIICNAAEANILLGNSFPNMTFNWTFIESPNVSGATSDSLLLPVNIKDLLNNSSNDVQNVLYKITPYAYGMCQQPDINLNINVNPTPLVNPISDITLCDSSTTNITLLSPSVFTSGVVTFNLEAIAPEGLTGYTAMATGLPNGHIISDKLINSTDGPLIVTYRVTPISGVACNNGPSQEFNVTVNPTPRLSAMPTSIIQCDSATTSISLQSPSVFTTGLVTFNLEASAPGGLTGYTAVATGLANGHIISDQLINSTDGPLTVTYRVTPVSGLACNNGHSHELNVTVNPTLRVSPLTPSIIQCNSATTSIGLQSPSLFTTGVLTFNLEASAPGGLTGYTAVATGLPNEYIISDQLINSTDGPLTVTYRVTPVSGVPCYNGPSHEFSVTVDPTPRVSALPTNIIQCNSATTAIILQSPSVFTTGVVTFNLEASAPGGLSGYTANSTGLPNGYIISDQLINSTDGPLTVTYRVTPVSGVACNNGLSHEISVTVNPTPRMSPIPASIIQCDLATTSISLQSPSVFTAGVVTFNLEASAPGGLTGFTPVATGLANGHLIADLLINSTDDPLTVNYRVTPVNGVACNNGLSHEFSVTVNPTPRVSPLPLSSTQCDSATTSISLQSPSIFTTSVVTFNLEASAPVGLSGFTAVATSLANGHIITDQLINTTDGPLNVSYRVTPVSGVPCNNGPTHEFSVTVNPTPRVSPLPASIILCDSTTTSISLQSPSVFTSGVVTFNLEAFGPPELTGYTVVATNLPNGYNIADQLINSTDGPLTVIYRVTPVSGVACNNGPSYEFSVTVNPTPRVSPLPANIILCDSTMTYIELLSPSTFTSGQVNFRYTATGSGAPGDITGFATDEVTGLPLSHLIQDVLINHTDQPQTVTYVITPVSPVGCNDGASHTFEVTVDPTPRIFPLTVDLVQCDSTMTSIELLSPSTFTSGQVSFRYTATGSGAPGDITGFATDEVTGLSLNHLIQDMLVNHTDQPQTVTYVISPVNPFGCNDGPSQTVVVTVDPTPRFFPLPVDVVQCDSTQTSIILQSPSTFTNGEISFRYIGIASGNVGDITGFEPFAGDLPLNHVIQDLLINHTDQPQTVTYIITPVSPIGCNYGLNHTVVVSVNPTPRILSTPSSDTLCFNEGISFTIASGNPSTIGTWVYDVEVDAPAGIVNESGGTSLYPGVYEQSSLINTDTVALTVIYRFIPRIINAGEYLNECSKGIVKEIRVIVNPEPRIFVNYLPDTILCYNEGISFSINTGNGLVQGNWVYDVLITEISDPASIEGENGGTDLSDLVFNQDLINTSNGLQWIEYTFKPKIKNVKIGKEYCESDNSRVIRVFINPQPIINVSPNPGTIICDNEGIEFDVLMGNTSYIGLWRYDVQFVASNPDAFINTTGGVDLDLANFSQNLIRNISDSLQYIDYTFIPKLKDPRAYREYCQNGITQTIRIWVNPRPRMLVQIPDTIYCDSSTVNFNLASLNGPVLGEKVYLVEIDYEAGAVTGNFNPGEILINDFSSVSVDLKNNTDSLQLITYTIRPRIRNPKGINPGEYCENGFDTIITVYLNPTPRMTAIQEHDIYCDSSQILISLLSANPSHTGEKYFYLESGSTGDVSNIKPSGYYPMADITDFLINNEHDYKDVTYKFTPVFRDYRNTGEMNFCTNGINETVTISVNPTPVIQVFKPDEDTVLCNNYSVEFSFFNNQVFAGTGIIGYKLNTQYSQSDVNGVKTDVDNNLDSFTDILENTSDSIQEVYYKFTPVIYNARAGFDCDRGSAVTMPVRVLPELFSIAEADTFIGDWNLRCYGLGNGKLNLSVHGGYYLQPYNFIWNKEGTEMNPVNAEHLTELNAGTYNLNISDGIGCSFNTSYTLTQPPEVIITDSIIQQTCGVLDAEIWLHIEGGTPGFKYLWKVPDGSDRYTRDITGLRFGAYYFSLTDTNNCITNAAPYLLAPGDITVTVQNRSVYGDYNIKCNGESNGSIYVVLGGGTGNIELYTYNWQEIYTGVTHSYSKIDSAWNLKAGTYTLNVMDEIGCPGSSELIEIKEPPPISVSRAGTLQNPPFDISCFGVDDGIIDLAINGGHLERWPTSVQYEWTRDGYPEFVRSTRDISGLQAGTYYVAVKDSFGCQTSSEFTLSQPDRLMLDTISLTDYNGYQVSCFGSDNSEIKLEVSGGYKPNQDYLYEWSSADGQLTDRFQLNQQNIPAGTYTLKVTDNINCSKEWDFVILQPDSLNVNPVFTDYNAYQISCNELSDGGITLNAGGGVGPYNFLWSTDVGSELIIDQEDQVNLRAGIYKVKITDSNLCTGEWEFTLNEPDKLQTAYYTTPVNCYGTNNGTIDLFVSGGVENYSFLWNNGAGTEDLDSLPIGVYIVNVTDANGCIISNSVEIMEPPEIKIDFTVPLKNGKMISCYGESDASIFTHVTGGYGEYNYKWIIRPGKVSSIPDDTPHQEGISAGKYVLAVSDNYGCSVLDSVIIEEPTPLIVEIYPDNPSCYSFKNGKINLIVYGGTPAYEIIWSIDQSGSYAYDLGEGEYSVSIEDLNNCKLDTFATLSQPDPITIEKIIEFPFCQDSYDGKIELSKIDGGTFPFSVQWQDGTNGTYLDAVEEGVYIVTITDNNKCVFKDTTQLISLNKSCLDIPTAFTPNGDGYNDTWEIGNIEIYPQARVEIYNRWGELIFSSGNGYEKKWDGTYKGRDLPIDSYHFIITPKKGREPVLGAVTIIK